jgi:hypothetical protein
MGVCMLVMDACLSKPCMQDAVPANFWAALLEVMNHCLPCSKHDYLA